MIYLSFRFIFILTPCSDNSIWTVEAVEAVLQFCLLLTHISPTKISEVALTSALTDTCILRTFWSWILFALSPEPAYHNTHIILTKGKQLVEIVWCTLHIQAVTTTYTDFNIDQHAKQGPHEANTTAIKYRLCKW